MVFKFTLFYKYSNIYIQKYRWFNNSINKYVGKMSKRKNSIFTFYLRLLNFNGFKFTLLYYYSDIYIEKDSCSNKSTNE
jgi:hypothetical protein